MTRIQRYGLLSVGIGALVLGIGSLGAGNLFYTNHWGGAIFAPYAILIGMLLIVVAFRWDKTLPIDRRKS